MSPCFSQDLMIPCGSGQLEARLAYLDDCPGDTGVILCPPHPLLAGNMENNVILAMAATLVQHFPVLSFNYRSVGKSFRPDPDLPLFEYWTGLDNEGSFGEVISDTRELLKRSSRYFRKYHLIGYSFGSFVGLSALSDSALSFTAVTPPLAEHDFRALAGIPCCTCLLFAGNDSLLDREGVELPSGAVVHEVPGSDHFFLGSEKKVAEYVESFLLSIR